jgi:hypothetical protein
VPSGAKQASAKKREGLAATASGLRAIAIATSYIQMIDSSSIRVHQHAANARKKTAPVAWVARVAA